MSRKLLMLAAAVVLLASAPTALAGPVVAGFDTSFLGPNDDGSTGLVNIGFDVNFFGVTHDDLFINNNGNFTFTSPSGTFTPSNLTNPTGNPIIAAFFGDVDTRGIGTLTYGNGTFEGRNAFGATWTNVGYFSVQTNKTNTFQILLVDRSDTGTGNFDIVFNYDQVQWETGGASGGVNGLGGVSAAVGFNSGTGTSFQLPGSLVNGALIDGGPNALVSNRLNSTEDGRYIFSAREGDVITGSPVPEPASMGMLAVGAVGMLGAQFRRRRAVAASA